MYFILLQGGYSLKKRIWELDTLRGILMIAIMAYHLFYDLVFLFGLVALDTPFLRGLYRFCNDWLGSPFLVLSGLCVTLGSRPIRRGLQVLAGEWSSPPQRQGCTLWALPERTSSFILVSSTVWAAVCSCGPCLKSCRFRRCWD